MINLTINGKAIQAPEGATILEAARANGIDIPTLCYDKAVEIYGACGLCVVEAEGIPKLLIVGIGSCRSNLLRSCRNAVHHRFLSRSSRHCCCSSCCIYFFTS